MPRFLLPTGECFETERDENFAFDITIRAPLVGLIVAYRGTLQPTTARSGNDAGIQLRETAAR